jgi:hypothetical protein
MTRFRAKLTIAAAITALAIAVTVPFALAQTVPNSAPAPRGDETGAGMMYGQARAPSQGQAQGPAQGGYGPNMMYGQAQTPGQEQSQVPAPGSAQGPAQAGYGPGMMYGQGQGGYGPGMMGGYGAGWMGGYGGLLVPILLVLAVAGLVVWFVKQKSK